MPIVQERVSTHRWTPPWLRFQHEERYAWIAARYASGCRVLDAASANAYGTAILQQAGTALAVAVDLSLEPLIEARQLGSVPGPLIEASATDLPFRSASFNLFVSLETIEHIDEVRSYLREARRVLSDDGLFICSTPNRRVMNPGRSLSDRPFNPFHVREYSRAEFTDCLSECFSNVELFGQSAFSPAYVSILFALGTRLPWLAAKLHQARKLLFLPFETRRRHAVRSLPWSHGEPEALTAVCSGPRS